MKRTKRFFAAAIAATLLFSSMTAFAADGTDPTDPNHTGGNIDGSGDLEGWVDKDVFRIVLPTVTDVNFTTDPQGLLHVADDTKYGIEKGAVYFENVDATGGASTYSNKSDAITIINKSSYDIKVKLNVTLDTGDITLVDSIAALTDAEKPSLYMGLIIDTTEEALTANYAAQDQIVHGVPEADGTTVTKGYKIVADPKADGSGYEYSYELTSGFADTDAESISYQLTGKCDSTADWGKISNKTVTAKVVWSCVRDGVVADAAPVIPATATYDTANDVGTIVVDLGSGSMATKIASVSYGGNSTNMPNVLTYTEPQDGTIQYTISSWKTQVGAKKYFKVTLEDGTTGVVEVTIQ